MGFKDNLKQQSAEMFYNKNKDRLTQIQGKALSVKIEEKSILWILHKIIVTVLVKPESSKNTTLCIYKKKKWFKKPKFIVLNQGNSLIVQGLKTKNKKDNKEYIEILNIRNNNTKTFLHPVEGGDNIKVQKVRQNPKFK
ncbi:hypothetical protein SAMN02745248_00663 [Hathewaya proteolytica DSM 3090]|uniref:Uncharacterized protein n=1 Tax=Hathewaya proteolytica DSM 3090 TaxID=1121331 RepID=A0A1M6L8C0_9CLOT|nr:hypothetical protein [Hathewaya proteolytica]SHJ67430.1 hypothetical protein SAMN02745248_00663 [Hathewaya proteolytica DSM 3090]